VADAKVGLVGGDGKREGDGDCVEVVLVVEGDSVRVWVGGEGDGCGGCPAIAAYITIRVII
jgi:hypothetical protein